jgi:23S rRNA (guanosine2251-2'-O)-methyltransferase
MHLARAFDCALMESQRRFVNPSISGAGGNRLRKKPFRRAAGKVHSAEKPAFPKPPQARSPSHSQPHSQPRGAEKPPAKIAPPFRRASAQVALLYGFHAVREALQAKKRRPLALFATEAAATRLAADCAAVGLVPQIVDAEDLSRKLGPEAVHQGVLLEAEPLPAPDLDEIESKSGLVLVLDQITDPHNVGAIVRSAAAFGVDALVTTERHAPEFTGLLAKAASGGLEHVAIVPVVNLARALKELGELGYLRVGLDSQAPLTLEEAPLTRPLALVLGAEDKGLRRLTRETCDLLARLDMPGAIKSLNVSNASAVALALAQRRLGPGAS